MRTILGRKNEKLKRSKRVLFNCIVECREIIDLILSQDNYTLYVNDYETLVARVEVDFKLGEALKKCKDPDQVLDHVLSRDNIIALFTDGSKSVESLAVGSASICPTLQKSVTVSLNKCASVYVRMCCNYECH
ncbi:hypothetical protein QAD02_015571 [Eretmocerus hayati]|uniref:Uncharacterized protein n=1 Tax=Eretmocerus hayati TaxID=131215 RepID=A0ACC2P916_9HYME|nr:hypothetical protein QAD02_015571 [Eretmocerus hayati]